jgi:exosortase
MANSDTPAAPGLRSLHAGLAVAALLAVWGMFLYVAHFYWGNQSYYNFGWFVPVLVGYLLVVRFREGKFQPGPPAGPGRMAVFWVLLVGTAVLVFFARLFSEPDIFWRVPLWANGLVLLAFSYACLGLFGGRAALRTFAFPFFFLLMALPWPYDVETWIIQSLTQWVADLTVFVINLIGYPAVAMGNTIRIGDAQVGVDEACSGIRSLQALVMIALFFGEFFAFGWLRRGLMLLGALFLSMAFNGTRAIILTLVTINGTEEKFNFWHDFLGNFNAIICGILLFALAELMTWLGGKPRAHRPAITWRLRGRPLGMALAGLAAGFFLSEAAVQGYYGWREANRDPLSKLVVRIPEDGHLTSTPMEVPERTREILQYEFGGQMQLRWSSGLQATLMHYGYSGEDRLASLAGFGHSPEICMTGAGARLVAEKPPLTVDVLGTPWPARHYAFVFDQQLIRQPVQVFYLIWEPRQAGVAARKLEDRGRDWSVRWELVKNGRRDFGRQVLLVYFHGDLPDAFVRRQFADLVDQVVRAGDPARTKD